MQIEQRPSKPRPRQAGAMATERISASPAVRRDRMNPISVRPIAARWATTLRSRREAGKLVLAPAAQERGRVHGGDRGGVLRARSAKAGAGRASRRVTKFIIGAAVERRFAAARRARGDIVASAAMASGKPAPIRATQAISGAGRASTATGAASSGDRAAATDCAAEPTRQAGVADAACTASRKGASRGAVNVRPPGAKTCR